VKYLFSQNVKRDDRNIFNRACYNGHLEVIKYLISEGCDINSFYTSSGGGITGGSLYYAELGAENWDVIELLLSRGATTPYVDVVRYNLYDIEGAPPKSVLDCGWEAIRKYFENQRYQKKLILFYHLSHIISVEIIHLICDFFLIY